MKLIYSHLQKFLPELNVDPQKLRDDLTMIGHFCNFYEEIEGEVVFDLDIKVNRGDCLGYYGMARDLAVLYNTPIVTPELLDIPKDLPSLPIKITTDKVSRVMAVKLSSLKNSASPSWLSKFIRLHGNKSINTLVDLTNYLMFLYGIPNHAFDTNKSGDKLIWELNPGFKEFKSLDGSVLELHPEVLMINNSQKPLSLSFWGGESCAIENNTTEVIIEFAIYDPITVRQNSRSLRATTEAATRLEKILDPNLIPTALNHFIKLVSELTEAKISSSLFDYYPTKTVAPSIKFDFNLPTQLSGISITSEFGNKVLTQLGCTISSDSSDVTPPTIRTDISLPEDLAEEVIRFYGYQNIPTDKPLLYKDTPNITPKVLHLIEKLKDELIADGYDEVLTWPLVNKAESDKTIKTQNSINDEYVYLRESLIPSLKLQLNQYSRYKLPNPKFFEIAKVYWQENSQYFERYALGKFDGQTFSEIILDDTPTPDSYIPEDIQNHSIELTSQIITLDANVTLPNQEEPLELINKYTALIDQSIFWSMEIIDIYQSRYTFRVRYYNCDDKTAKKVHLKTFNLENY